MNYMTPALAQKQRELLEQQLQDHRANDLRASKLLWLAMLITFLLYLAFNLHLYLGDPLTWSAYFTELTATVGFLFMLGLVVLMAAFLSWVKHHAYLHFGFYGSVGLVVVTVIGFALFAEFFSSSASQDAKSNAMLERSSAYKSTLQAPTAAPIDSSLALQLASAQQKLAQCQARLASGKEKHCNGDAAKVQALENAQSTALTAQVQIAANTTKLNHDRQDKLKADSYNPVIVFMAQLLAGNGDYIDYIKAAVVIIMLIVAVSFEILHHFLSRSKERSYAAIKHLELELAKLTDSSTTLPQPSPKQPMGFTQNPRSNAVLSPDPPVPEPRFKYQDDEKAKFPMGFAIPSPTKSTDARLGTAEHQLSIPQISSFASELTKAGIPFPHDPVLNRTADLDSINRIIGKAQNPRLNAVRTAEPPVLNTMTATVPERQTAEEKLSNPSNFALLQKYVKHERFDEAFIGIATGNTKCSQKQAMKAHSIGGDMAGWLMIILDAWGIITEPNPNMGNTRTLIQVLTLEQAQAELNDVKSEILGN